MIDNSLHSDLQSSSYPPSTAASDLDQQMLDYRKQRRRILNEERRRHKQARPRTDADAIIHIALIWAPYGGVPTEEIFVKFGVSQTQFIADLWRAVVRRGCDPVTCRLLTDTYPPPSPPRADRREGKV